MSNLNTHGSMLSAQKL